jgi:hypothetical protein
LQVYPIGKKCRRVSGGRLDDASIAMFGACWGCLHPDQPRRRRSL